MRMALSLSRSDTQMTPFDWLDKPLHECLKWIELINKVAKEEEKARKK